MTEKIPFLVWHLIREDRPYGPYCSHFVSTGLVLKATTSGLIHYIYHNGMSQFLVMLWVSHRRAFQTRKNLEQGNEILCATLVFGEPGSYFNTSPFQLTSNSYSV